MRGSRKALAALAALWFLVSPLLVFAAEQRDGSAIVGTPYGQPGAASDGSAYRVLKADPDGILRVTEEYPPQLQSEVFPASDTTYAVYNGVLRPVGLGWNAAQFGARTVLVTRVQAGDPNTLRLYLFGSDDNVNYFPILTDGGWSTWASGAGDTAKVDTLEIRIPTLLQGPNTVRQFKLSLPENNVYFGRYMQIWAMRTDSTRASNTVKLGLSYEGRWK